MTTDTNSELTLTRVFEAPRQLVWDAYTVPEQLAKWWGPASMHTPLETITVDLRPGGAFKLTMVANDDDAVRYTSEMVFREVDPIDRLVYGWEAQGRGIEAGQVTVTLTERDGKTHLHQQYVGEISQDMFPLMEQGTNEQLDKLAVLVER